VKQQTLTEQIQSQVGELLTQYKEHWFPVTLILGGREVFADAMLPERGEIKVRIHKNGNFEYFSFTRIGELKKIKDGYDKFEAQARKRIFKEELPPELPKESLIKICWRCGCEIDVYNESINIDEELFIYCKKPSCTEAWRRATKRQLRTCPRCNGDGNISAYSHIENGICFRCKGEGKI